MTDQTRSYLTIAPFLIALAPVLYGNVVARKAGILDDALLDESDPYYRVDREVGSLASQGLKTGEAVSLVIPFTGPLSGDLEYVRAVTTAVKAAFPEFAVLSLATATHYRDTGEELLTEPYVGAETAADVGRGQEAEQAWKARIAADPGVYGVLVGRRFDYAQVVLMLNRDQDEITAFRRIVEFLERRDIPAYEWYLKTDIQPAREYARIHPAGWVVARGLMDAALLSDILKLSSVGLLLVGAAFYLSLMSGRQALISTGVVAICFVYARGSIGLLQWLGFAVFERVYSLLVYTAIIVAGISYAARKFDAYNEQRARHPEMTRSGIWRLTGPVNETILVASVVAILNFATLYQIQIRGILEVGVFSALGIAYLVLLTLFFLPALHVLVGGETSPPRPGRLSGAWNDALRAVSRRCWAWTCVRPAHPHPARRSTVIVLTVLLVATSMVASDYAGLRRGAAFIEVLTRPLEYIHGTISFRASQILNRPGNYGFDRLSFLVRPRSAGGETPVCEPRFIERVAAYQADLATVPGAREVSSAVTSLGVISRETLHRALPRTVQEAHDALTQLEWDLGPQVKEQLWYPGGYVVFASLADEDSREVSDFLAASSRVAERHPELEIVPFGKTTIYPQTDKYVREGKPRNVVTSQWMVIVVFALWAIWKNRRRAAAARLRGWRTGFVLNIPFVFATSTIVIVMALLRVPLDQATACIAALAINAAADFGLYLVADYQARIHEADTPEQALAFALKDKGHVVVVDVLLNSLCFMPLMLSRFLPVARLGWIMITMLLACGFGALALMPTYLPWCTRTAAGEEGVDR